jgi:hypothetical protein
MQMAHMHKPNWVHWHKPDWHTMGIRLEHLIHDPRFWAGLALAILLGAMILATIFSKYTGGTPMTTYPIYPYMP